jgi:hypothetical protein
MFIRHILSHSLRIHFNFILSPTPLFPRVFFLEVLRSAFSADLRYPIRATSCATLNLFDLLDLMMFYEEYKVRSWALCHEVFSSLSHSPENPSLKPSPLQCQARLHNCTQIVHPDEDLKWAATTNHYDCRPTYSRTPAPVRTFQGTHNPQKQTKPKATMCNPKTPK